MRNIPQSTPKNQATVTLPPHLSRQLKKYLWKLESLINTTSFDKKLSSVVDSVLYLLQEGQMQ